jgi:hypothetical protein
MPKGIYKRVLPVWNKGKKLGPNPEHSKRMKGRPSWNKGLSGWAKGTNAGFQKKHPFFKGAEKGWIKKGDKEENGLAWKGDNVGKVGVHIWVVRHKGYAKNYKCVDCEKPAIHWSNKDHKYKRNLDDYYARCGKCHKKYDKNL